MRDNAQAFATRFPATLSARQVADALGLHPTPPIDDAIAAPYATPYAEGLTHSATGWQRLMLLDSDGFYSWQRLSQAQSWHWLAGAPVVVTASPDGHDAQAAHLGPDAALNQQARLDFAAHIWQTATTLGAWSLVRCDTEAAPDAASIEMASPDWFPKPRAPKAGSR